MLTIRCTRSLLTRLHATPSSEASTPTTRLGDWYGDVIARPQPLALFVSERTLLVVLVPLEPTVSLLERWRVQLRDLLERLGVPAPAIADELAACEPVAVAATANRRVLGYLAEAKLQLQLRRADEGAAALRENEYRLAHTAYAALQSQPPAGLVGEIFSLPHRPQSAPLH